MLVLTLAVAVQIAILIAVPLSKARARLEGGTVLLKVEPVDPYAMLSGYYVRLGYEISRPTAFPGATADGPTREVIAVIQPGPDGVWRPVRLLPTAPSSLANGQVFMRGHQRGSWIEYGIESFHFPEGQREVIGDDLRRNIASAQVEVKVDSDGNASLLRLRIADRVYE